MGVAEPWTCPTCARELATNFCGQCGERARSPSDLTLRGFLVQVFQAFSNVDGRLLRSFRCLVTRPGELSVAFVRGQRKPYVGPFQVFFLANVLFFWVQSLVDIPVFSSTLYSHLSYNWKDLAQRLVARRLERVGVPLEKFAPRFDEAVQLHAKSLIVLMAFVFALFLPLVFRRVRQPFVGHVVFSLHFYAFLLILFSVTLPIAALVARMGGFGLDERGLDSVLTWLNVAACALYLFLATGRFYGTRGVAHGLRALVLSLVVLAIAAGYRFALFLLTLYTTS